MDRDRELLDLARHTRNYHHYLAALGVTDLPRVELQPAQALKDLRAYLGDCERCPLSQGRTNIIFGEGNPQAGLMFVGEGPGRDEDLQGRPFVGKSGRLLTDIIVKGLEMRREDCYIANVVKCRPPENRDPRPEEVGACLPFLRAQIAAIRPKVICALGRVAAQNLLGVNTPLTGLRHRFHDLDGIPVMPTYHPSFLLRKPEMKRDVWEDVKLIIARLESGKN